MVDGSFAGPAGGVVAAGGWSPGVWAVIVEQRVIKTTKRIRKFIGAESTHFHFRRSKNLSGRFRARMADAKDGRDSAPRCPRRVQRRNAWRDLYVHPQPSFRPLDAGGNIAGAMSLPHQGLATVIWSMFPMSCPF